MANLGQQSVSGVSVSSFFSIFDSGTDETPVRLILTGLRGCFWVDEETAASRAGGGGMGRMDEATVFPFLLFLKDLGFVVIRSND